MGQVDTFCPHCGAKLKQATPSPAPGAPKKAAEPPKENAPNGERVNPPMSRFAPTGLSLGVLGLVGAILSFINFLFLIYCYTLVAIITIIGIILSIVGIAKNRKLGGNKTGKSLALTSLILNAGALAIASGNFIYLIIRSVIETLIAIW